MEIDHSLVFAVFVVLLIGANPSVADSEVKAAANMGLDPKTPLSLNDSKSLDEKNGRLKAIVDSTAKVDQTIGDEKSLGKLNEVNLGKSNLSKEVEVKQTDGVQAKKESSNEEIPVKESDKKEKPKEDLKSIEAPLGKYGEGTLSKSAPLRKESPQGEECESSSKCTNKKSNLVACLRVPGNESPDLSLLIRNQGKSPLTVTVSAPAFVHLERKKIQLQGKEDRKVKVSIGNGGTGHVIILATGSSTCRLDFRHLIGHKLRKENEKSPKLIYAGFTNRVSSIGVISLAALLMMAATCMCMSMRRKHISSNGCKYQKLDVVRPVSAGQEAELDINDGWENSWGDSWDDEEAAMTPTMPVTPSLSSKGLASRRFNKEEWKD